MRLSLAPFLALPLALAAAPAAADCGDANDTRQMIACEHQELAAADKRLNEVYRNLVAVVKDDEKKMNLLRDAQRKWIAFRDALCRLEGDSARGGTLEPLLETACLATQTKDQVRRLEEALALHR